MKEPAAKGSVRIAEVRTELKKLYDPLKEQGVKSLKGYTHIRAYHACRPLSVEQYLENGIQKRSKIELLSETIIRLGGLRLPDDEIRRAFDGVWKDYHGEADCNNGVYLGAWKEELLNESAHYLIYGSETMNATAVALAPNEWEVNRFRDELKKTGRPTLIVCDIPLADIVEPYRSSLERIMPINGDAGFLVPCVAKENIIDFIYPTEMPDIYYWNSKYRFSE